MDRNRKRIYKLHDEKERLRYDNLVNRIREILPKFANANKMMKESGSLCDISAIETDRSSNDSKNHSDSESSMDVENEVRFIFNLLMLIFCQV